MNEDNLFRVGCGLEPANQALTSHCNGFPNLAKVEITYVGWMSKLGKQLDDKGLVILANNCPFLTGPSLSYCSFITDAGLRRLASCSKISSLKLNFTLRITGFVAYYILLWAAKILPFSTLLMLPVLNGWNTLESLKHLRTSQSWIVEHLWRVIWLC